MSGEEVEHSHLLSSSITGTYLPVRKVTVKSTTPDAWALRSALESPVQLIEGIGQLHEAVVVLQVVKEPLRQVRVTVVRAGNGTRHGGDGVGVVTGVDGGEKGLLEVLRAGEEAPKGTREGAQDVRPIVPDGKRRLACG
jgi:hypothetical protein